MLFYLMYFYLAVSNSVSTNVLVLFTLYHV